MTAPVFLFTPETIEPADAVASATFGTVLMLTGPEARHAVTVKRLRALERVDLGDGAGLPWVTPTHRLGSGSHLVASLPAAQALAVVAAEVEAVEVGDELPLIPLSAS